GVQPVNQLALDGGHDRELWKVNMCIHETVQNDLLLEIPKLGIRQLRTRVFARDADEFLTVDYQKSGIVKIDAVRSNRVHQQSFEYPPSIASHIAADPCEGTVLPE